MAGYRPIKGILYEFSLVGCCIAISTMTSLPKKGRQKMFKQHQAQQHAIFNEARDKFLAEPFVLISLEQHFSNLIFQKLQEHMGRIRSDYDEASYLYSFWMNYPPEKRGRAPVGDQFPWIEVGEHAVGSKVIDFLDGYSPRDVG